MHPTAPDTSALGARDSLRTLADQLRAFRAEREWDRYHTPKNLAVAVAIEAAELLEHFQWHTDDEVAERLAHDPGPVAEELADVAIYLVQLADAAGVDLLDAIVEKIERNAERYPVSLARGNNRKYTELRP
jgi:NTP pyrophosphatase (non-canonical NTP hydrolase)